MSEALRINEARAEDVLRRIEAARQLGEKALELRRVSDHLREAVAIMMGYEKGDPVLIAPKGMAIQVKVDNPEDELKAMYLDEDDRPDGGDDGWSLANESWVYDQYIHQDEEGKDTFLGRSVSYDEKTNSFLIFNLRRDFAVSYKEGVSLSMVPLET